MFVMTGDLHANARGEMAKFFELEHLTKEDYVVIAGDFGLCWYKEGENVDQELMLEYFSKMNYTVLFVDGNHENHAILDSFEVREWNGGKVHFLRPNVIHLMRGQVYNIDGRIITTMGGAPSHDIQDGIFDPADYENEEALVQAIRELEKAKGGYQYALYRIKNVNWWDRELPSEDEWAEWDNNLKKVDYKVDYIITHEAPASVVPFVGIFPPTDMAKRLEDFRQKIDYKKWVFGHYHLDKILNDREIVVYDNCIPMA